MCKKKAAPHDLAIIQMIHCDCNTSNSTDTDIGTNCTAVLIAVPVIILRKKNEIIATSRTQTEIILAF